MKEIYALLEENYVEDDDAMFRFAYPVPFLRWALTPPEWKREWHISVRVKATKRLVAFISGVPATIRVKDKQMPGVEINFLCVHKKLRDKRLAPLMIREVTRRVNLHDIWQAVYTAGIRIPTPVSSTTYYHRSLQPEKLIDVGFSSVPMRFRNAFKDPMGMTKKYYALPEKTQVPGFRPMVKKDLPHAHRLLSEYLKKFDMSIEFTLADFTHWLRTRENVIYSFVVEDPATKEITDFGSFYLIPSTIMQSDKYKVLNAAYLYYYASTKTPLKDLVNDLLVSAHNLGFDVFNCLDIMENTTFLEDLKFGRGDGNLHYYMYNYRTGNGLNPDHIGITML